MKYVLIALLLTVLCLGQDDASAPPANCGRTTGSSQGIPVDQLNQQKARAVLKQAIQALGGDAYLHWKEMSTEGRAYSFHHGEANSLGILFWRFREFPDKDRIEFGKKREWWQIYTGDKGYEVTYKGVRNLDVKDELTPYLRRRHYSLDMVLRQWLNQPGIALFYEGQTVAAQKETDQVTVMNNKNEGVTLYLDINTHLPVKKSYSWRDPTDKERNVEEEIFDDYRQVQGIMTPFNTTRIFNGDMAAQTFLTDAKYNQNVSDAFFVPGASKAAKTVD